MAAQNIKQWKSAVAKKSIIYLRGGFIEHAEGQQLTDIQCISYMYVQWEEKSSK